MLYIPFLGIRAGFFLTLSVWLILMVFGIVKKRRTSFFVLGTLAQIAVFPALSVIAMFAITPFYEYGGAVRDSQSWQEKWIQPPANAVNMKFWKSTACEELTGTTSRDAWDTWRGQYQIDRPNWMSPPHTPLLVEAIELNSGNWVGYISEAAPNGASRQTWFRETDGMMIYRRNYW